MQSSTFVLPRCFGFVYGVCTACVFLSECWNMLCLLHIYAWTCSHFMYLLTLWIKDLGRMLWFCSKMVGASLLKFFSFSFVSENHQANKPESSNWLTDWYCRVCKNEVLARKMLRANGHLRAVPTRNAEGKWLAWAWASSLHQPPAFCFRCWFSGSTYSGAWSFGSNDHSQ